MDKDAQTDPTNPLADPQREAFASAVARGVAPLDAYKMADIGSSTSGANDMARRPEVKARIEALTDREVRIAKAAAAPTLAALLRIVDRLQGASGPLAREARLTLRLIGELRTVVDQEQREAAGPAPAPALAPPTQLTPQQWIDKFAHLGARWAEGSDPKQRGD